MDVEEAQSALHEMMALGHTDPPPSLLLAEHEKTAKLLGQTNSSNSALLFGSLLLLPKYQANCVRLESLVHLALVTEDGDGELSQRKARKCFDDLGEGRCGIREDPIEDIFVNLVVTEQRNFRVLEGTWESGGFYLQRFLDVLSTTPDDGEFRELRTSSDALLKLSEELCERSGLERYCVGDEYPAKQLDPADISEGAADRLVFTESDLAELGLRKKDLDPFIITSDWLERLSDIPIGHSPLQQLPLLDRDDGVAFILPTATSYATRMYLTRVLIDTGYQQPLVDRLGAAYIRLLKHIPEFDLPRRYPFRFAGEPLQTTECLAEIDSGRYVQSIFVLDDFHDVKRTGISGANESLSKHADVIFDAVKRARDHARQQSGFRRGLTLVVTCGIGRGGGLLIPDLGADWSVEALNAPDLVTLTHTKNLSIKRLWRILAAFNQLDQAGIKLFNINGLLNLIGWMKQNDWQVIPHSQMPNDFRLGGFLQLPTNALCDLRVSSAIESDRVGIVKPNGSIVACRRAAESFFDSENALPVYMPEIVDVDDIPFIYRSEQTSWWCTVTGENFGALYERWLTMKTWLPRIVPAIEQEVSGIPAVVSINVHFSGCVGDGPIQSVPSDSEIRDSITIDESKAGVVRVTVGEAFERGMQQPTNVSEAALVEKLSLAILRMAGVSDSDKLLPTLQERIVPNEHARHLHAFHARSFRDYVAPDLRESLIDIDELDSAALRVGLAFRVESRENGRFSTRSKLQSTKLLNAIVKNLEAELCALVRKFDRQQLVEMAMLNHERAIFSRKRWMRTARANLAIRAQHEDAEDVIARKDMELSSVIFPSHVIAEVAVSEAPLTEGIAPGELDFTRMMNLVSAIAQFGGWSDAIHRDAMPPGLTITALGDVQADTQFSNIVLMPFSRTQSKHRLTDSVESFAENYEAPEVDGAPSSFPQQFEEAWEKEIGAKLDDIRRFMDCVDDIGIEKENAVFQMTRSDLLSACDIDGRIAEQILESFSLKPTASMHVLPECMKQHVVEAGDTLESIAKLFNGIKVQAIEDANPESEGFPLSEDSKLQIPFEYHPQDVEIWRFRRQLSAVRRPILQIDDEADPNYLVAPDPLLPALPIIPFSAAVPVVAE